MAGVAFDLRPHFSAAGIQSSSLLELTCQCSRELDEDALAVFMRLGYFLGSDTPLRAIRAVMPPIERVHCSELQRGALIDEYIERFRAAIQRTLPCEHPAVLLSGGRDSRHILLELVRSGVKADCIT